MRANRAAFDRWRIVPRMLRDVAERDTSVELFGRTLPSPFLIAPIGVLEMAHREAERAVARAVRDLGLPMIYSNQASVPMEEVTEILGDAPRWFQLYWSTREELVESFARRAEACGCEAIVVTLDTTMLGWRTRDLDLGWLPFLRGMGIAQYTSDPVFTRLLVGAAPTRSQPEPRRNLAALRVLIQFGAQLSGPVPRCPPLGPRPGRGAALHPDLLAAVAHLGRPALPARAHLGADPAEGRAATRTTRGARSTRASTGSWSRTTAAARWTARSRRSTRCPPIVEAVDDRIPVLLDSGIRSGADIFKALALGARAVLLGRPHVYGLALAGEAGVREVVTNFMADFDLTMGLAGCRSVSEITSETLVPAPG